MNEQNIESIENLITQLENNQIDSRQCRQDMAQTLRLSLSLTSTDYTDLGTTILHSISSCPTGQKRRLALVLLRICGCEQILTDNDLSECQREIVELVEKQCPDLTKVINEYKNNELTYRKFEKISNIHKNVCDKLEELKHPFGNLEDLAHRRESIMRAITQSSCKNYLSIFGYRTTHTIVDTILNEVQNTVEFRGYEKQDSIDRLISNIPEHEKFCKEKPNFLILNYLQPFIQATERLALNLRQSLKTDFACKFHTPNSSKHVEKKYPLHNTKRRFEIPLTIENIGPGMAQDVSVYFVADTDDCEIESEEVYYGPISPGNHVITLLMKLTKPRSEVTVEVEIRWKIVGETKLQTHSFQTCISGQRTDVDWDKQESLDNPYSLEVVEERDFYGRHNVLQNSVDLLSSKAPHSFCITGQKRVGKSSLAKAIETRLKRIDASYTYHVIYLETGEFIHADGSDTMKELGVQLDQFLSSYLPSTIPWLDQNYSTTLSPLNRLAQQLATHCEDKRFVVILDEFDELNESLYLYGDLAATFFLNLRTFASKKNVALVLVGAEKMPHIMTYQGERLNKLKQISLDSFNLETEWTDYRSLIQDPVDDFIMYHENAIRLLFELTNGHPYFTKVVCREVFDMCMDNRDVEVSTHDIQRAFDRTISSLETNAFAHYWRDGIRGDREEAEIVAVRRCRALVSWARTIRSGSKATLKEMKNHLYSGVDVEEIKSELAELVRRRIFSDRDGIYVPVVALFARWLTEEGIGRIVDGELADQLSEQRKKADDEAYVKSQEIKDLVATWQTYQGRPIGLENLRAWIEQVGTNVEQRMLFNILKHLRFVSEDHILEAFEIMYSSISKRFPWTTRAKGARTRQDIVLVHFGGQFQSGPYYAKLFAQINKLSLSHIMSVERLASKMETKDFAEGVELVVVVDDMIGTGNTLVDGFGESKEIFERFGIGSSIPLYICVFCATLDGEALINKSLVREFVDAQLLCHEILSDQHFAFTEGKGIWSSLDERDKAKTLLTDLGGRIDKNRRLGYKNQGLMLTFSRNCPNNSLPVLWGVGKSNNAPWDPIFQRQL